MTLEGEYENNNNVDEKSKSVPFRSRILAKIQFFSGEMKQLFSQPYLKYLTITSFVDFGLMAR